MIVRYSIQFLIESDYKEAQTYSRTFTPDSTDCMDVSSALHQDYYNYWTLSPGIYSLYVSVSDAYQKLLYSTALPLKIEPMSIQLSSQTTDTPPRVAPIVKPDITIDRNYCGDGTCNSGEDCQSCPLDCGLCRPYSCSPSCKLPDCQCAQTRHPTIQDTSKIPQFVAITWDDAQTPTTFSHMMEVARSTAVVRGDVHVK